jgi:two-component system, OmpR family, sensor histidine kinase VicK
VILTTRWNPSHIEIQHLNEDIAKLPLKIISSVKETLDCCTDQNGVALLMEYEKLWDAIRNLKDKGIRVRFVTAFNEGNIPFCRQMMKCGELFHNDAVIGTFQIADGIDYLCYITESGGQIALGGGEQQEQQLFHTNTKSFVDMQQYLFDNLCINGIPAKEKIKEIGRGTRNDFTDKVAEPAEITKIVNNLLASARYEVLLLFSTANSFYRAENSGMLNLLQQVPDDVAVKVLIPAGGADGNIEKETIQDFRQKGGQTDVQYITKPLQTKIMTIVVVDQASSMAIEVKDDTAKSFEETSVVVIHSNSESTVSSCISIFDTLWIQSELEKQNKIKQAYFEMFKGLKLKDESYTHQWSFEQRKEN